MNSRRPKPDCTMTCSLRNSTQCVCNLISVHSENSPISHGLRIGLGHYYGGRSLPPCVRGSIGSSYWSTSTHSSAAVPA